MIERRRTSTSVLVLLGALVALAGPSTAQAAPPTRGPVDLPEFDNISIFCGFPLRTETLRNNLTEKIFSDGRSLITGNATTRLTNLSSGSSIEVKESGSVKTNAAQTTLTLNGRIILYEFPNEPFGPGVSLFIGHTVATFDQPGGFFFSSLETTGRRVDLCAALSR